MNRTASGPAAVGPQQSKMMRCSTPKCRWESQEADRSIHHEKRTTGAFALIWISKSPYLGRLFSPDRQGENEIIFCDQSDATGRGRNAQGREAHRGGLDARCATNSSGWWCQIFYDCLKFNLHLKSSARRALKYHPMFSL